MHPRIHPPTDDDTNFASHLGHQAMKYHRLNTGFRTIHIAPAQAPRRDRRDMYCVLRTPSTVFMHSQIARRCGLPPLAIPEREPPFPI